MARGQRPLDCRVFVGGRPWEELTEPEREAFRKHCAASMGRVFSDYFSRHPEEYAQLCRQLDERPPGDRTAD